LGNSSPFDGQRLFEGRPKPTDPPERNTAAQTGLLDGGKGIEKSGAISDTEVTPNGVPTATAPRIIALHFGLEVGEAGR